jgi:tripartite-type tricarboxylate transporter receptor subunit TctC
MSPLNRNSLLRNAFALLFGSCLVAGAGEARAQVNFKGKTIDVIIGSTPGGGTDGTTRLVGSFLEKYLPGNPTMRYRNIPGGHGSKALNHFAKLKPDGLTWLGGSSSHVNPNSLRKDVVEYDPTKFHIFGGVERGGSIVFMRKDHAANLTDKSKPPVVAGVIDGDRNWEQMIAWGAEYLGWNVRFVVGYPGSAMMSLAIRRGETHMMGTSNLFILKDFFKTGEYVGVAQVGGGAEAGADVEQRSEFGNIPTFQKLVEGKMTGLAAEAFEFWTAINEIDKWYALPPGTPKEIVDVYRAAWDKIVKDPEFVRQGKLLFSADFRPAAGAQVTENVRKSAYPKSEIVSFIDQIKTRHGLPAEPLSEAELAALAKAKGLDKMEVPKVEAKLVAVGNGGREIEFAVGGASKKLEVSGSRTAVNIGGRKADRAELKAGATCTIEFTDDAKEASGVTCP